MVKLFWSLQTENFQSKQDFLFGSKKFPNGLCAFHLPISTSSRPFGLDGYTWGNVCGNGTRISHGNFHSGF